MSVSLTILIFFPVVLGLLAALSPSGVAAWVALLGTLVPLIYAVIMIADFKTGTTGLQHATDKSWIPSLGIRYKIGVDGLNVWLVGLATVVATASALWLLVRPVERPRLFAFHFGLGETAVLGAFVAQDLALFVLFFDLMLVPFYFLVSA